VRGWCTLVSSVPLTRLTGKGKRAAGRTAVRPYALSHSVGGESGVRAKKHAHPRTTTYAMYSYQGWKHTLVGANGKRQQQRRYPATHPCPKPTRVGEPSSSPRNAICTTCTHPCPKPTRVGAHGRAPLQPFP